jgi:four helix bundle protein
VKNFQDLKVWEKAHHLTLEIYQKTKDFPSEERYELTRQIRRCAASIPTNIAEGCGRSGDAELSRFMQIAMGSASELEYTLLLAKDLGLLNGTTYQPLVDEVYEVKRMLAALIKKLKAER